MNREEKSGYPGLAQAWLIFAVFIAVSLATGLIISLINNAIGTDNISIGNFFGYNLSMLFVIWFAWKNRKSQDATVFHFEAVNWSLLVLLTILTLSMAVVLDPLTNLLPLPEFMEQLFAMLAIPDIWTFLVVCITGPVLEELLFRGIILDGFLGRYPPGKAIFWSALLFGLFHLNPWQFIPGFLTGLLMGYVYFRTRSLIPVILIHIINNSFSWLIMYLYGEDVLSFRDLFTEQYEYYLLLGASVLVFGLGLMLLLQTLKKSRYPWT